MAEIKAFRGMRYNTEKQVKFLSFAVRLMTS